MSLYQYVFLNLTAFSLKLTDQSSEERKNDNVIIKTWFDEVNKQSRKD